MTPADMQRMRAEALWVAAAVFGKTGYDAEFVIHKADTVFLPYILNGTKTSHPQRHEDLQARAIRLRQLAYGLAADLTGYPQDIALQAAELLSLLDTLLAEDTP